jgi:hypothetical protein
MYRSRKDFELYSRDCGGISTGPERISSCSGGAAAAGYLHMLQNDRTSKSHSRLRHRTHLLEAIQSFLEREEKLAQVFHFAWRDGSMYLMRR